MKNPLILPLSYLLLALMACQTSTPTKPSLQTNLISQTTTTKVMFRAWDTKKLADTGTSSTITVITTPSQLGEIIILRWNDLRTRFTTEAYKPEAHRSPPKNWVYTNDKIEKSISKQPSGAFFISELIPGKNGGRQVEKFRLEKQTKSAP